MKNFKEFLFESTKEITFTFGRFNPPQIGHLKLLDATAKVSPKYVVYASHTTDTKKNPLPYDVKIKWMRKMFPRHARSILVDTSVKTALDALVKFYDQGYTKVNMVVGSDRVAEFNVLFSKYNGIKMRNGFYNFEGGVNVISAGERDPDAEDVTGMSASKMRAAASSNDFQIFSKGLPPGFKEGHLLFVDLRDAMGLKEDVSRDRIELKPVSDIRERYVSGDLFSVGDLVVIKESEELATILMKGSNYLLVETSDGKKLRKWLDSIELLEDKGSYRHHQFQKDPKHAKQHAMTHFDKDNDGDVDELDKTTPDELIGTEKGGTLKMFKKYSKEKQHTKVGHAFESVKEEK